MLNRRILRIKAFKVLFSYAENPTMTLPEAEALLEASCEATRSLYLFMLDIIPYLTAEARTRIENARKKFNPTEEEERNPNLKFVRNSLSPLLEQDPDFQKIISRRKLSWEPRRRLCQKCLRLNPDKGIFQGIYGFGQTSVEEDTRLFTRIFEEEFVDNEELDKILEDMSILWCDDLAYSLTVCCDTLKAFAKGYRWSLPPLYRSEMMQDKGAAGRATRRSCTSFSAPRSRATANTRRLWRTAHPNGERQAFHHRHGPHRDGALRGQGVSFAAGARDHQ